MVWYLKNDIPKKVSLITNFFNNNFPKHKTACLITPDPPGCLFRFNSDSIGPSLSQRLYFSEDYLEQKEFEEFEELLNKDGSHIAEELKKSGEMDLLFSIKNNGFETVPRKDFVGAHEI